MKVLLLFPIADGQTGAAIKYAFEKLGHRIMVVDAKIHPEFSYTAAAEFKPDLIFCSRTMELTEYVKQIKERFKDATICMWNVDTRADINQWEHLFPLIKLVDYYFVVASGLIPEWRRLNPNTFHLPQGLQNEIYHKPEEINEIDRRKYFCDVSFAGRDRSHRRPFLNAVDKMNINFRKWGYGGNPKIINNEHNKMAFLSRINLCCSGWSENEAYTSVRNYKVMGAGGFVIELSRRNLGKIFPLDLPGLMGTYVSASDLVQRIRYWLDHEEERKAIAERGHEWAHTNATYTHRIRKALGIMGL